MRRHRLIFTSRYDSLELNLVQFNRLHYAISRPHGTNCYLGRGVWMKDRCLVSSRHSFMFERGSWHTYITDVHGCIRSFLHHGHLDRQLHGRVSS